MQKLINKGFLNPHSALCACAVCSDDPTVVSVVGCNELKGYKRTKSNDCRKI